MKYTYYAKYSPSVNPTVREVFDTFNEDQKSCLYGIVGMAVKDKDEEIEKLKRKIKNLEKEISNLKKED